MTGLTYIEEGRPAMALPILRELKQRTPVARMFEAMAAAREGRKSEALSLMRPFEEKYPEPGVANQWFGLVYAFLGDEANAVKWLQRSVDLHEWQALNLAVHPVYAPMRNSAAFRALKKRIGLE
jgi:predicted Zn-dependent protease